MTLLDTRKALAAALTTSQGEREAAQLAMLWMEKTTGWGAAEQWLNRETALTPKQMAAFEAGAKALVQGMPLQYLVGEAWFLGRRFAVNSAVLIPRPETEELVQWVLSEWGPEKTCNLLEVGTGSGCLAISLQLARPHWGVMALDVSREALEVARSNGEALGANINWQALDFLDQQQRKNLPVTDVLISNPPYIPQREAASLSPQVRDHEPHLALFVPDENPLLFYQALADFASKHLSAAGALYVEIHENLGPGVLSLFSTIFETVESRKDFYGRERMVKATRLKQS